VRSEPEFPEAFADYIAMVERETGVPVGIVSVGPDREATVIR
jgi:adenylosuccinate synthase